MTPDTLVIGKEGMMGRALCDVLGARAKGLSKVECNFHAIDFLDAVEAAFLAQPFSTLINAAAYTRVDDAESEDSGELMRVNAVAPGELAAWCAKRGVVFVHFSTDYVFDGSGHVAWKESHSSSPLNAYGMSKLMGERAVLAAGGKHLLFRLSWVYDGVGRNFFTRIRELMAQREIISVVADQVGAPSYAPQVAKAVVLSLMRAGESDSFPSGIFHLCHGGEVSWHGFAKAILAREQALQPALPCREVMAVSTAEYGAKAARPLNSRLDCMFLRERLGVQLPHWEMGLANFYAGIGI